MNQVKSKDSNSKQGSELLEAVGGLEAAQLIVDNAPKGATDVIHIKPLESIGFRYLETIEYSKDVDGERWHWNKVHGWFQSQMPLEMAAKLTGRHSHFSLESLHTAITEQIKNDRQISCSNKLAKQLLDLAGGLTAARIIDINAPEGSTYFSQCGADGLYYREASFGYDCWKDGAWYADDFMFEESKANRTTIRLSYLRSAIADYESEQRVTELNQSVVQAKAALLTFSYEPKYKAVSTHAELVLHEQIKNLKSSRNFWRLMFFAVFLGYGVAWWLV